MEDFQFIKKDNSINKNQFYNIIVKNMMEKQDIDFERNRAQLLQIMEQHVTNTNDLEDILYELEEMIAFRNEDKTNRSHGYYISFRPSKKLEGLYQRIEDENLARNTISNFYRQLFNSYARMPQDAREEIIFQEQVQWIEKSIRLKRKLKINLSGSSIDFLPYMLVKTEDEQYNYLIGGVQKKGYLRIFSLHLYKLKDIYLTKEIYSFSEEEIDLFEKSIIRGPREVNIRTARVVVQFTEKGKQLFRKMYVNRPIPASIGGNIYTFESSVDNIFIYFSRFGKEAIILEPINLRNQLKKFYLSGYNAYNTTTSLNE